jgi:hypothetical protein
MFTSGMCFDVLTALGTKWKSRSVKVLELLRIMPGKTQPLGLITFDLLDLEFSSSRLMRFRIAQLNRVVDGA